MSLLFDDWSCCSLGFVCSCSLLVVVLRSLFAACGLTCLCWLLCVVVVCCC